MVSRVKQVPQNHTAEWLFYTDKRYKDPFNEVELTAVFTTPDGEELVVPGFWAGGGLWKIRYASHQVGRHSFYTVCSDKSNPDLNGVKGAVEIIPYRGSNPLFRHGPLTVDESKKFLRHRDGTPFFWLGDTWWMGFTKRLSWPHGFKLLAEDRARKGFTVIQIVAGLYPDMPPFDPRGVNEAGFPWDEGFIRVNPLYFDMADRRIAWLIQRGLVPCIVGAWGYYIDFAGEDVMKKHWRYIVARYWAYPVVWCVAGEAVMPYYLSEVRGDVEKLKKYVYKTRSRWTNVARYIRSIDPAHHPVTIHPTDTGRGMVDDPSVIDLDMLQTGHSGARSLPNTIRLITESRASRPKMPVIVGEVCYEGIMGSSWEDVQRLMFWTSILSGAAGYTYGANGVWQVNTETQPFGPSPHGQSWGDTPWSEAYRLPGSKQVGLGKKLLERYRWWLFEPHPEWVKPHWTVEDPFKPYAAGIPGEVRVIYFSPPHFGHGPPKIKELDSEYNAYYFDPRTGREYWIGKINADKNREWQPPNPPKIQDWVLILETFE